MKLKNKNILVTGGTGMIGQELVQQLISEKANITVVSLDKINLPKGVKFLRLDLREFSNCLKCCKNKDIVFHLAGVKGSPKMALEKPASFMVPTIQFSFNMLEAAKRSGVKSYLFTSSVGVYHPKKLLLEDDVWKTFPSVNDWYAGWAKRLCELQVEAYNKQYKDMKISVVRPANVYGPFDNFDPNNAMVIPSLINRIVNGENPLKIWGDGSAVRDFIYSKDVARGMILVVKKGVNYPVNIGSGKGFTIRHLVRSLISIFENKKIKVEWDKSKPTGDKRRVMSMKKMRKLGFKNSISLKEGLKKTVDWYLDNKDKKNYKYNSFNEKKF